MQANASALVEQAVAIAQSVIGSRPHGAAHGRVSIVIPAYNAAATLPETLASCLAQTYGDIEVIVVDDGSSDATAQAAAAMGARVNVITKPNGGVGSARNVGLEASSGEFIAWMDADDVMQPWRIATQVKALRENEDLALVCGNFSAFRSGEADFDQSHGSSYYRQVRLSGGIEKLYDGTRTFHSPPGAPPARLLVGRLSERLVRGNFVHPPTVLMRRSAGLEAKGLDEQLRYGTEYDMLLRMSRTNTFGHLDIPVIRYRRSDSQLSNDSRLALDTLVVLDKVVRDDPSFVRAHSTMIRARRAQVLLEAADMKAYAEPRGALRLLMQSFAYAPPGTKAARVAAKATLPRGIVNLVKRGFARS